MDATQWLAGYAERLGIDPPTEQEMTTLLSLAGVAAHSSERIAAPVACWLAARSGADLETARRLADEVAGDA